MRRSGVGSPCVSSRYAAGFGWALGSPCCTEIGTPCWLVEDKERNRHTEIAANYTGHIQWINRSLGMAPDARPWSTFPWHVPNGGTQQNGCPCDFPKVECPKAFRSKSPMSQGSCRQYLHTALKSKSRAMGGGRGLALGVRQKTLAGSAKEI